MCGAFAYHAVMVLVAGLRSPARRTPVPPRPLTIAIAHNKGGVGKTTSTLVLGRILARHWRVELVDYDETQHLRETVLDLSPGDSPSVTRRLWLRESTIRQSDLVLIDSPPARGASTRRALVEADLVLIPAPPERMAIRAMQLMFEVIDDVRRDRQQGNPFLQVLGVVPTIYDSRWSESRGYLEQMAQICAERQVRLFPPVRRRQSYGYMSTAGGDYYPVADAIASLLRVHEDPDA
jgi:cellulose biosynthesis protein BcsQ